MKKPEDVLINVIKGLTSECSSLLERYNPESETVSNLKSTFFSFAKKTATVAAKLGANVAGNFIGIEGASNIISEALNDDNNDHKDVYKEIRPLEFRNALSKVINECLRADKENGDSKKKGFLFFIDDLDRINPEDAVQILELLKNLFEVENCIFVLAIDYEVVVKGLKSKFQGSVSDDDRAYRSFFDKIIQLPFSMPISSYDVSKFVEESLIGINYMTHDELNSSINYENNEQKKIIDVLSSLVELSTGPNPRSIKRLLNSLSLIQIMQKINNLNNNDGIPTELSAIDKTINFGFVCIQIAYPYIYDLLIQQSNFLGWNEESAINFHLKKLDDDKIEELNVMDEFNEEWEKILYRACLKNSFLNIRAISISRILNTIRFTVNKEDNLDDFGAEINRIIDLSAVTTVTQVDNTLKEKKVRSRGTVVLDNIMDLDMKGMTTTSKNKILDFFKELGTKFEVVPCQGITRNWIEIKYNSKEIIKLNPRKKFYSVIWHLPKNKWDKNNFAKDYPEIYEYSNKIEKITLLDRCFTTTLQSQQDEDVSFELMKLFCETVAPMLE